MKMQPINKGVKCYLFMSETGHLKLSLFLNKETIENAVLTTGKQPIGIFRDIEISEVKR